MNTSPAPPDLVATYRLQLHAGFTLEDAAALVPYLERLGVSHLYLSPISQAAPGSTHGYDQCDPTQVSAELGGEAGFRHLAAVVRSHGMGIILDIVPNHMATAESNPWWWELLRSGQQGRAGVYFDVDWHCPVEGLEGRVSLPVLGAPLDEVLERGELRLVEHKGEVALEYFEQHFPLASTAAARPGEAVTPDLLAGQRYRLGWWREAAATLNYRRFFDINSLAGLREEDPAVFVTVHALPLQLVAQGDVQGLRVDHVDGLREPRAYLETLRRRAPGCWLLVEKILEPGERLPDDWPVDGTTGYDFIHRLQGVFVDPEGEEPLTRFYGEFTGEPGDYREVVHRAKLEAAERLFQPDVSRLERLLAEVVAEAVLDFPREVRIAALDQVAACLPVYRAYATAGSPMSPDDRQRVETATALAAAADPSIPPGLLELIRRVLLLEVEGAAALELALRFQQLSGPVMAKGVEDTAFYRYHRLTCLNEVGGDPGAFGVSLQEFHDANAATNAGYPRAMLASSTHDTKRSEDVRARLSLLAQVPGEWAAAVRRWSTMNERHRAHGDPDRNAEYLLYQTLVGAWPLPEDRAQAYMLKAAREAKQHTTWTDPDEQYEQDLRAFVHGALSDEAFLADVAAFAEPLVDPGRQVSLAQTLVKLTAPGIPDLYQGSELWDLSLVDPDNRRPVDYALRAELMGVQRGAVESGSVEENLIRDRWDDGLGKLHVTARALGARHASPRAFEPGSTYTPLYAEGPAAGHLLAFARGTAADPYTVVVVVPRLTLRATPGWTGTTLDLGPGSWAELLWGGYSAEGPEVDVAQLFERYPLALLERHA